MEAEDFPVEHLDLDRLIANLVEVSSRRDECDAKAQVSEGDDKSYWISQTDQLQAEAKLLDELIVRKRADEKD